MTTCNLCGAPDLEHNPRGSGAGQKICPNGEACAVRAELRKQREWLTAFLYLLMRDEIPTVAALVESVAEVRDKKDVAVFTSKELAALAERYARRIVGDVEQIGELEKVKCRICGRGDCSCTGYTG